MKTIVSIVLAAVLVSPVHAQDPAAKPAGKAETQPAAAKRNMGKATPIVMEKDREVYGAELTMKEDTKLADIIKEPKAHEGRKLRVSGTIQSVCQKKGCWMMLKDGDSVVQVKFHDYSFFVPLDVSGRTASVEGMAKETVISEAMRKHYAEDAGKSKEEIARIKGEEKAVMLIVEAVEIGGAPKADGAKGAESKPAAKKPE